MTPSEPENLSSESDAKAPIKGAVPEGESAPDADTKAGDLTGSAPEVGSADTEATEDRAQVDQAPLDQGEIEPTGAATAEGVVVTDAVPGDLAYEQGSIVVGQSCTDAGVARTDTGADGDGASYAGTTVTGTLPDVVAGQTQALRFRVTVK